MFIKTVSTTSGINPIKFDETGGVFYWILNTGSSTVYASTKSTFTAGDDGVVSLGPKESRRLETNNDTIYILGEGQVEIHNQRDGICSFKQAPTSSGSGGGGTVDAYTKTESDAKYAQKTDIPSSLPANGGNADYATNAGNANAVGGIQISDIRQITRNAIQTLPTPPIAECDYFVSNADSTFPYYFGNLSIRYGSYTAEFVAIYQTTGDDKSIWYNLYHDGWVGWKEISTTPIKKMTFPSVGTNSGGGGGLFSADFGTPITIACTSRNDTQCTPFYYRDGNHWLLLAKDAATLDPIPEGTYSFDVWYI